MCAHRALSCCYRTAFIYVSLCTVAHAFSKANQNVFSESRTPPPSPAVRIGTVRQSVINREIDCSFCLFNLLHSCIRVYACMCRKNLDGSYSIMHTYMRIVRVRIARDRILISSRFDTFAALLIKYYICVTSEVYLRYILRFINRYK